ncbi:tRNA1(Val) (adenine(37)-N6)-methyltransferase [Paenibacillus sp. ACRRX]|uniref:tRNA1(Val) (adenine(37)-N6)-methyltransferase n=1 Tax=unclassified Paenibacillus TaxID=185978 RepID=UPI001EF7126C|nr:MULTISPECIES: tRNA1(Val) (adenine(37)-N6)-methyltransferase [unclassified Paenibacillus]MCG7410795.1 tRNA1(Val) (adenine(37)-N6)-methyltransferase [Paenibacillus sp. ACRRX]MDK8184078.1 tRNA1(Val) (adenine(37)-N6)-methyltransferase [Paenibacillus sp. UMB4589-SE434]
MNVTLHPSERLDDLLTHDLRIIQSDEVFSFSLDAVLLARFAAVPVRGRILDLCTGNGAIPLLLTTRTKAHIDGIEIQPRLADMAQRSVEINGLTGQIKIMEGDLKTLRLVGDQNLYDAITVNPPYMSVASGDLKENEHKAMARHEIGCTLEDVIAACARLLKVGGKLSMVHRPSRLVDMMALMRTYRLEPKRIRFVHPKAGSEANMVLIEAARNGKPEVRLMPPLIVYNEDNTYCEELMHIYYGAKSELRNE